MQRSSASAQVSEINSKKGLLLVPPRLPAEELVPPASTRKQNLVSNEKEEEKKERSKQGNGGREVQKGSSEMKQAEKTTKTRWTMSRGAQKGRRRPKNCRSSRRVPKLSLLCAICVFLIAAFLLVCRRWIWLPLIG